MYREFCILNTKYPVIFIHANNLPEWWRYEEKPPAGDLSQFHTAISLPQTDWVTSTLPTACQPPTICPKDEHFDQDQAWSLSCQPVGIMSRRLGRNHLLGIWANFWPTVLVVRKALYRFEVIKLSRNLKYVTLFVYIRPKLNNYQPSEGRGRKQQRAPQVRNVAKGGML